MIATHPRSWVAAGLACRPLVWLGRRSYAVYLWFWPVFMLTRPHSDVPLTGTPLLALRMAITLGLATASYRWVEQPVREGRPGPGVGRPPLGTGPPGPPVGHRHPVGGGIGGGPAGGVDRGAGGPPRARPALRPAGGGVGLGLGRARPRLDGGHRGRASTPSTTVPAVAAPVDTTVAGGGGRGAAGGGRARPRPSAPAPAARASAGHAGHRHRGVGDDRGPAGDGGGGDLRRRRHRPPVRRLAGRRPRPAGLGRAWARSSSSTWATTGPSPRASSTS